MRIGNRNAANSLDANSIQLNNEIQAYLKLFDNVMIVDPFSNDTFELDSNIVKSKSKPCKLSCPLYNDTCGCICKDALSIGDTKTRFTFNSNEAYLVMCKPIKIRFKEYTLILIKKVNPSFAFGSYKSDEAINQITNISSNLVLDELTQIFNRAYLNKNIEYQIKEALNKNNNLSLACIDIDNFKKFNDTYGHEFGDKVLVAVANCMKEALYGLDNSYPVRIGGDEFMVVGLGVPKSRFKMIMTKLCQLVQATKLPYENQMVGICISIGVGEILEDGVDNYKDLYNKADEGLYRAKEAGKNCVR